MRQQDTLEAQLVAWCHQVYRAGYTPGRSGNASCREGHSELLITPSGYCLGEMTEESVVRVMPDGRSSQPDKKPSMELPMHQAVYAERPDIGAIIHAHPTKATALAVSGHSLDFHIIPELSLSLGAVPLVGYYLPGTRALADAVGHAFKNSQAILLANHGVVVAGDTLKEAFYNLQLLESFAEIYLLSQMLGGVQKLSPDQVAAIMALQPGISHERQRQNLPV